MLLNRVLAKTRPRVEGLLRNRTYASLPFHSHAPYQNHPAPVLQRYGTTVLCIRKDDKVVLASDGQVTQSNMCLKPNARKLRRLAGNKVIVGFAGTTADAFTLLERLETKLDEHPGQLLRACVELAKMWRTDRYLRNLEAAMVVADEALSLEVIGNGDVLESHDGIIGIGSGGGYAIAAARALYDLPTLSAKDIAERAMKVAADLCIYTNHHFVFEELASIAPPRPREPEKVNDCERASSVEGGSSSIRSADDTTSEKQDGKNGSTSGFEVVTSDNVPSATG